MSSRPNSPPLLSQADWPWGSFCQPERLSYVWSRLRSAMCREEIQPSRTPRTLPAGHSAPLRKVMYRLGVNCMEAGLGTTGGRPGNDETLGTRLTHALDDLPEARRQCRRNEHHSVPVRKELRRVAHGVQAGPKTAPPRSRGTLTRFLQYVHFGV